MNVITISCLIMLGLTRLTTAADYHDNIKCVLVEHSEDETCKLLFNFLNFLETPAFTESQRRKYVGCFQDNMDKRIFRGYTERQTTKMTTDFCIDLCRKHRFTYAGTQFRYY